MRYRNHECPEGARMDWKKLSEAKPPHIPGCYMIWQPGWRAGFEGWIDGGGNWTCANDSERIVNPTHFAPMPEPPINP